MNLARVSRIIEAPIGEVWAVTSSFGAITAWMPSVNKVSIEGAGIGAVRTVTLGDNIARETLTEVDPVAYRVRYGISAHGMDRLKNFVGGTDLTSLGDKLTKVEWVAEVDSLEGDVTPFAAYLEAFIAESLGGLGAFLKAPVREG